MILDKKAQVVRLVQHRVFTPAPSDPINFEQTVEATILDWRKRFVLRAIWYDPYQMQATAQRLAKAGMRSKKSADRPQLDRRPRATSSI